MNITWSPTYIRVARRLEDEYGITRTQLEDAAHFVECRVNEAVGRINCRPFFGQVYVGHSGGKDSVLVQWLVDRADVPQLFSLHTAKPEGVRNAVHPLTQEFLYGLNRPILHVPENAMQDVLKRFGLEVQIDGTRAAEAERRDGRDVGIVINGENKSRREMMCYMENGLFGLNFVYPIFDWSDAEVWAAIFAHNIPFSAEYL